MTTSGAWRDYEAEVYAELQSKYPEAVIRRDARIRGSRSRRSRQIDVVVEETLRGTTVITAVDAKRHDRRIDVKQVEAFLGLLRDIGVDRGIMVSAKGYSKAALARAFNDDVDVDLEILSLEDFKQWQAAGAIPYAGRNAVLLPAPLGWVVDGERRTGTLATLYRKGLAFEDAAREHEFMYVRIWDRVPPIESLDQLLAKQAEDIRAHAPNAVISVREVECREGARTCVRRADIQGYPTPEITGFVEFPHAIFFAVLFTPLVAEGRNTRKLEYLLRKVLPMSMRHAAQQTGAELDE